MFGGRERKGECLDKFTLICLLLSHSWGPWFVRVCFVEIPKCFISHSFQEGVRFLGVVCFRITFPFDEVFNTSSLSL